MIITSRPRASTRYSLYQRQLWYIESYVMFIVLLTSNIFLYRDKSLHLYKTYFAVFTSKFQCAVKLNKTKVISPTTELVSAMGRYLKWRHKLLHNAKSLSKLECKAACDVISALGQTERLPTLLTLRNLWSLLEVKSQSVNVKYVLWSWNLTILLRNKIFWG